MIIGGKRQGAGRPKGSKNKLTAEPTKYLPKVPLSKYDKCLSAIKKILGINK